MTTFVYKVPYKREIFARLKFSRISHLNGNSRKFIPVKIIPYAHVIPVYVYMLTQAAIIICVIVYMVTFLLWILLLCMPSPKGLVSITLCPAAIKDANDAKLASCGCGISGAYSQNRENFVLASFREIYENLCSRKFPTIR